MNPMLRSLTYAQLVTYYDNMVGVKVGKRPTKKASADARHDAYMEIVARVEKAQKDVSALEVGMRVMVTPTSLTLDFRVPEEAKIVDMNATDCMLLFLDGRNVSVGKDKVRPVLPAGVTPLGRR